MFSTSSTFEARDSKRPSLFSLGQEELDVPPIREVIKPQVVTRNQHYDVALYPGGEAGVALIFISPPLTSSLCEKVTQLVKTALREVAFLDDWVEIRHSERNTAFAFVSDPLGAGDVAERIYHSLNNDHTQWVPLELDA